VGNESSEIPAISGDGTVVAFWTFASNLAADDTNDHGDVYVRRLDSAVTLAVARTTTGAFAPRGSEEPGISGNGRCVAFTAYSPLTPDTSPSDAGVVYLATIAGECPNDPPDTNLTGGPAPKTKSRAAAFTFTSNDATASFQCSLDGAAYAACASGQAYGGLAEGAHTFDVRAVDPIGNLDASPASQHWTIDITAPTLKVAILRQRLKQVRARGLRFRVKSSEHTDLRATLLRNGRRVGTAHVKLGTSGKVVAVKLSRKARNALRRARSARFVLVLVAADDVGNKTTVKRKARIRR